jgi:hypothetical protein
MFDSFPRPARDRKIGFHYFPDAAHYTPRDQQQWLPVLERLGASWLTLVAEPHEVIPREFLQSLRDLDIEPVVEVTQRPNLKVERRELQAQAQHYASNGVRYITFLREPNLERAWSVGEWQKPRLVERLTALLLPALETFAEVGLHPLLPPLFPGGDYWDMAFFTEMLDAVHQKGSRNLLNRLGVCLHHYAFNRPLSWGQGGQSRWKESRPFRTVGEDHRGWRMWEWYDDITRAKLGRSLPVISGATGALLGSRDQADLPPTTAEQHSERNLSLVRAMKMGDVPEFLFNLNFWLLAADPSHRAYDTAWFRGEGTPLPIVERMQAAYMISRKPQSVEKGTPNGITHYLLLPQWDWGISSLHWETVLPFVQATRATVGFQLSEARRAHRVTLFIGAQGHDERVVAELKAAGCLVEAIPAPDLATLRANLAKQQHP